MKADPQTQALNVMIEEAQSQGKPWSEMEPQELRDQLAQGGPLGPPPVRLDDIAQERTVPGPAGEIPGPRLHSSPVVRGVYLHIHGGGWVIGSHDGAGRATLGTRPGDATGGGLGGLPALARASISGAE